MKKFELACATRTETGKKANKIARGQNKVPCILYGGAKETMFSINITEANKLIVSPDIYLVELSLEGEKTNAIVKEVQFHPVTDAILHIDFMEVFVAKPIVMNVPVILQGLAEGVKAGGKLALEMRKLKVRGLYDNIPEKLFINVDALGLGKTIQVKELSFENLELLNTSNAVVCAVKLTRAARGAAAAAAGKK